MKTLKTLVLLLCCGGLWCQVHSSRPSPTFSKEAVSSIDQNIMGWSYSIDGQWISQEMTIPPRLISSNDKKYDTHRNKLGADNINKLILFRASFGKDTLLCLVKLYSVGHYKYEAIQKGWQEYQVGYYYIFKQNELKKLKAIHEESQLIKIHLMDEGSLGKIKEGKVLDELKKKVNIQDNTNRELVFVAKTGSEDKKLYFQFASVDLNGGDVKGVVEDFTHEGHSLYGSLSLINYLHYEYDKKDLLKFFQLDKS